MEVYLRFRQTMKMSKNTVSTLTGLLTRDCEHLLTVCLALALERSASLGKYLLGVNEIRSTLV